MTITLILAALLTTATAPTVNVSTLDGASVTGTLTELSLDSLTLQTADGPRTVASEQILSLSPAETSPADGEKPSAWVELVDGSKLTLNQFTVKGGVASVTAQNKTIELPTSAIRQVRFSPPDAFAAWPADVVAEAAGDLLAVRKKDAVDFLTGVLGDVTETNVEFRVDEDTIPVKRAKVDGLVYYHKAADQQLEARCIVESAAGWRLQAKDVSLSEGQLKVSTTAGPVLELPWTQVSRVDFSAGKVTYLSDLEPESLQWTPLVSLGDWEAQQQFYGPRRDAGRENEPLRIAGHTYAKGLALTARTELSYRLPSGARKFKALAGIDDSVGAGPSVRLQIAADGKTLFDASVGGGQSPTELDLDVSGARRLSILVDYGDGVDTGDYLDLADARIVK